MKFKKVSLAIVAALSLGVSAPSMAKIPVTDADSIATDKINEQQQREIHARTWSARGGVKVAPMTF